MPKLWEKHIVFVSNIAELTGYAANITINLIALSKTMKEIHILEDSVMRTSTVRTFLQPNLAQMLLTPPISIAAIK